MAGVGADTQDAILAFVVSYLNAASWGDKYDLASLLLAAHLGAITLRGGGAGGAGPVLSESAGSVSRSYANTLMMQAGMGIYGATVWGQQYATLRAACFSGGMVL
jgi:hypothetical protein